MKTFLTILLFGLLHAQLNADKEPLTEPHPTSPKDATSDTQPTVTKLTEAQLADIKLMWETVEMQGTSKKKASSDRAQDAAHRVFTSIKLTGLTREQVISLLGDPQKANDSIYNFPFYPAPKGDLVYRFDTGSHGWQFNISFDQNGRISQLKPLGIE